MLNSEYCRLLLTVSLVGAPIKLAEGWTYRSVLETTVSDMISVDHM